MEGSTLVLYFSDEVLGRLVVSLHNFHKRKYLQDQEQNTWRTKRCIIEGVKGTYDSYFSNSDMYCTLVVLYLGIFISSGNDFEFRLKYLSSNLPTENTCAFFQMLNLQLSFTKSRFLVTLLFRVNVRWNVLARGQLAVGLISKFLLQ